MTSEPTISVLLPVRNAAAFLTEALESVAAQTTADFEVIAVDDGSTDASPSLLETHARRWRWLRVVTTPPQGLAPALNVAIAQARGRLLARMDADDVCLPQRFAAQVTYLDRHPEIAVCGTAFTTFGAVAPATVQPPVGHEAIRARLLFGCPFAHPTVMMRHELFTRGFGYEPAARLEDYDLWARVCHDHRGANLPEVLLRYRIHPQQFTAGPAEIRRQAGSDIGVRLLRRSGLVVEEGEARAHGWCGFENVPPPRDQLPAIARWLKRLQSECTPARGWTAAAVRREVEEAWWRVAQRAPAHAGEAGGFLRARVGGFSLRTLRRAWSLARRRPSPLQS